MTRGRPKVEEPREHKLLIRLTEKEHQIISEAAKLSGQSASSYGRDNLLKTAKRKTK